jgi:His/Glu/Gln/Arg/opine family amino acid ABC transporter permease subunit
LIKLRSLRLARCNIRESKKADRMPNIVRCVVVALLTLFLGGCGNGNYHWGWYLVSPFTEAGQQNILFLAAGMGNTVVVAAGAITISVVVGLLVAMLALSANRGARALNRIYVETLRAIPMLVMILWVYYGLPVVLGISLDTFSAGILALALCDSAFEAEILRAGIQSIDRGQHEAADSLGLNYVDKMRYIILPQAIRRVLPPLGNQFVYMLKASSLLSIIAVSELTRRANELVVTEYRPLEIYTVLVLEYLALILVVSWAFRKLESRMGRSDSRKSALESTL